VARRCHPRERCGNVRDAATDRTIYERPDVSLVPGLMGELIDWINDESEVPGRQC